MIQQLIPYRWRELWWQIRYRQLTETDIALFSLLENLPGLVLDVGANRGQFALSLFIANRSLNVLSLEANPELRWILSFIRLLHPLRFKFKLVGAGAQTQTLCLHIPTSTTMDLSANASFDPSEFDKDYVKTRLEHYAGGPQGKYHFYQRHARIIPVDTLALKPLAIKIDVEGFELPALQGMEKTLQQHHPLLMIEMNNQDLFMPWLQQKGYTFYRYDPSNRCLQPLSAKEWTLNVFCLHPQTPNHIRERLIKPPGNNLDNQPHSATAHDK